MKKSPCIKTHKSDEAMLITPDLVNCDRKTTKVRKEVTAQTKALHIVQKTIMSGESPSRDVGMLCLLKRTNQVGALDTSRTPIFNPF